VVDGGECVVDGRGLALEGGLQVAAVVADRPAARSLFLSGSAAVSASASQARYWRTFEAYVRRVCSDSGAVLSAAAYCSRTAVKGCDRPTAVRPRRGCAGSVLFSEADVFPRAAGDFAFSELIPRVYFREG
jgi:hypothetical protein